MAVMDIDWRPGPRRLRGFAATWLAAFALLGAVVAWRAGAFGAPVAWSGPWLAPLVLWVVAAAVGAIGLARPFAIRFVYVGWMAAAWPIGWAVTHLLLAVTYFVILTPVALVFRLAGRDALHRRFDRDALSYWVPRPPPPSVDRYFKQF